VNNEVQVEASADLGEGRRRGPGMLEFAALLARDLQRTRGRDASGHSADFLENMLTTLRQSGVVRTA
jgi:hypothetical protein